MHVCMYKRIGFTITTFLAALISLAMHKPPAPLFPRSVVYKKEARGEVEKVLLLAPFRFRTRTR